MISAVATLACASNELYDYTVNPAVADANLQLGAVETITALMTEEDQPEPQVPTGCQAYCMGSQPDVPTAYNAICHKSNQAGISSHRLASLSDDVNCASVTNLQTKTMRMQRSQRGR